MLPIVAERVADAFASQLLPAVPGLGEEFVAHRLQIIDHYLAQQLAYHFRKVREAVSHKL
jgi:hypothetical protein